LYELITEEYLVLVKKKYFIKYASARVTSALPILNFKFSYYIEHMQDSNHSLVDGLTRQLVNGDHQSRLEKEEFQNKMLLLLEQVSPSS